MRLLSSTQPLHSTWFAGMPAMYFQRGIASILTFDRIQFQDSNLQTQTQPRLKLKNFIFTFNIDIDKYMYAHSILRSDTINTQIRHHIIHTTLAVI